MVKFKCFVPPMQVLATHKYKTGFFNNYLLQSSQSEFFIKDNTTKTLYYDTSKVWCVSPLFLLQAPPSCHSVLKHRKR